MNEGGSFVFDCTVETGSPPFFIVFLDDSILTNRLSAVSIPMGVRYTFGPVTTSDSGSVLQCASANVFAVESATLDVMCEYHPCTNVIFAHATESNRYPFTRQLVEKHVLRKCPRWR